MKKTRAVLFEIVSDIQSKDMAPGDLLPPMAEMLCRYDASKSTLREALSMLELGGLVQMRPGIGNGRRVGGAHSENLATLLLPFLCVSRVSCDQLLEAWIASEPLLAEAAARNPNREAVRTALAPYLHSEGPCDHGHEAARALDFHDTVAALADNPVLSLVVRTFGYLVHDLYWSLTQTAPGAEQVRHEHRTVAEAIAAADPARARAAMETHLALMAEQVRRFVPRPKAEPIDWSLQSSRRRAPARRKAGRG